ncbi:MAG: gentisate 1,2-dioxygenase [Alphaproteobacteria bacterium]|jgi:gentisate 1,2-dioxygenase
MANLEPKFIDYSGSQFSGQHTHGDHSLDLWEPMVMPKEAIDAEIDRLASLSKPNNGVRRSRFVHPRSVDEKAQSWAPGVDVSLDVLLPGERTKAVRQNSSVVNFCIQGGGSIRQNGKMTKYGQYDLVTTPSMWVHEYVNDTDEMQVRLRYSNGALLERINIHYVDENPPAHGSAKDDLTVTAEEEGEWHHSKFGALQIGNEGAWLMPYEGLVNPPPAKIVSLHWPWEKVQRELDKYAESLGQDYEGRRLYLLYDPVTGRSNGTTANFFATITHRPAGISDRPHRHASAAMNYYFAGEGHSVVQGKEYPWKAGDFMFSAPGWAIHAHTADKGPVYELTIQDMPFCINTDCLLWQEDMKGPISMLGSHAGFLTNRDALAKAS